MIASIPFWDYLKVPYRDGGRDRLGVDCWGLMRLVYFEQFGIELPSYGGEYGSSSDLRGVARAIRSNLDDWRKLPDDREAVVGDGILFAPDLPKVGTHVGVIVGPILGHLHFIHVRGTGSHARIERLSDPLWRACRLGMYRNLELEQRRARCEISPSKAV